MINHLNNETSASQYCSYYLSDVCILRYLWQDQNTILAVKVSLDTPSMIQWHFRQLKSLKSIF